MKDFWELLDKTAENGCWEWTKCTARGYGITYITGSRKKAHRHAYELANGPLAEGAVVCHACDNRKCCNPEHLFSGSVKDNWHDAMNKGRAIAVPRPKPGAAHPSAKLTEVQRIEIRSLNESGMSKRSIARQFGVNEMTIRNIIDPTLAKRRWEIRKAGRLAGTAK